MGASGTELPGFGASLALSLVSLGLVCLVAFLVLRWLGRRSFARSDECIRVLGRCFLEPRRSVYLIAAGGRCFLVGVGEGPMSLLAEIDEASLPAARSGSPGTGSIFADVLAKVLRKGPR
ncbi:MAG: flagellar biosynthetic protein FliO [Deltaproteobacteria bacterium]|nr:flagellar biosynthetic protein FliO [Deltaproteobacteria bacterium]